MLQSERRPAVTFILCPARSFAISLTALKAKVYRSIRLTRTTVPATAPAGYGFLPAIAWVPILVLFLLPGAGARAQSTTSFSQTVNQRNTIGVLGASPTTALARGTSIAYTYTLHTGGAPAPTSETVQFYVDGAVLGSAQAITSIAGSNLLPYAQVSLVNGWTRNGTAPTLTANAVAGPDGSATTATQVVYPTTVSNTSGVQFAVPGTSYANKAMTLSIWAKSASPTTLSLTLADSPASSASQTGTCAVTSVWQRCTLTYTFPANAGTGFSAQFSSTNQASAQTINLWGAQVEQAAVAGPFVSTIGTARPTGGQGGSVTATFPNADIEVGTHTFDVVYSGDANFLPSTSNNLVLTIIQDVPTITLTSSPASSASYGQSVALTAHIVSSVIGSLDTPSGTVQFFDGATLLGTATLDDNAYAVLSISGASSLSAGAHSITALYSGEIDYSSVTSSALAYTITSVSNVVSIAVTSSLNPSTYGDAVTFTVVVSSPAGAVPTGSITLTDGGSALGTAALDVTGKAVYTVPLLTAGSHTLIVAYSGDNNYH